MAKAATTTKKHSARQRLKPGRARGRPVVKLLSVPQLRYVAHMVHAEGDLDDDTVLSLLTDHYESTKADHFIEKFSVSSVTLYKRTGLEQPLAANAVLAAVGSAAKKRELTLPIDYLVKFSHAVAPNEASRLCRAAEKRHDLDDIYELLAQKCKMTLGLVTKIKKGTVVPYSVANRFCHELTILAQIQINPHEAATRFNYKPVYERDPAFLNDVQEWVLANHS